MKYALLLLACLSTTAYSEVYKWVDADGKTHYGDRPVSDNAQEIAIKPEPESASSAAQEETIDNHKAIENWVKAGDAERESEKKKKAELKREKAIEQRKCAELRTELADLKKGGVVWYDLDKDGKRRFYSDKEIAAEVEGLKKFIRDNCPS